MVCDGCTASSSLNLFILFHSGPDPARRSDRAPPHSWWGGSGVHGAALLPKGGPGASVYRLATASQGSHPGSTKPAAGREIHGEFCPAEPKAPPSPCLTISCCSSLLGRGENIEKTT